MTAPSSPRWTAEIFRFIKAQLSSTTATLVDWAVMTGLILLRMHYLLAIVCGCLVGALTDFSLKRVWAFQTKDALRPQILRYVAVSTASAGLNCAIAYFLVEALSLAKVPAAVLASLVAGFAWNYPMHRLVVFRETSR